MSNTGASVGIDTTQPDKVRLGVIEEGKEVMALYLVPDDAEKIGHALIDRAKKVRASKPD